MTNKVGFKRLTDEATIPTKAHESDSGFDLYAATDVVIEPGETKVVPTGIAVQLPEGMDAQVRPRSGVTAKTKFRVQLGTIDNGYNGEIGVIVDNISTSDNDVYPLDEIKKYSRIAQLVVQYLPQVEAVEIDSLEDTARGEGGFGSTGIRDKECGKCSYCKNEIAGTPKSADNVICKTCGDIMTREHNR